MGKREPWWTWHWDRDDIEDVSIYTRITRWRRGSLLTIYKHVGEGSSTQWWFYGPFNLAIGFSYPVVREPEEIEPEAEPEPKVNTRRTNGDAPN